MPTSDEDLAKQADKVQKLRDQVASAEAERVQRERDSANDVAMLQLQAEEERLNAALVVAKDAKKAASVKDGNDAPLSAAKAEMEAAVAARKAAEASVAADPEGTVPTSTPVDAVVADKNGGNS